MTAAERVRSQVTRGAEEFSGSLDCSLRKSERWSTDPRRSMNHAVVAARIATRARDDDLSLCDLRIFVGVDLVPEGDDVATSVELLPGRPTNGVDGHRPGSCLQAEQRCIDHGTVPEFHVLERAGLCLLCLGHNKGANRRRNICDPLPPIAVAATLEFEALVMNANIISSFDVLLGSS